MKLTKKRLPNGNYAVTTEEGWPAGTIMAHDGQGFGKITGWIPILEGDAGPEQKRLKDALAWMQGEVDWPEQQPTPAPDPCAGCTQDAIHCSDCGDGENHSDKKRHQVCERCGAILDPGCETWLELDNTTNLYLAEGEALPAGHVSQGGFPFGSECAKKANKPMKGGR